MEPNNSADLPESIFFMARKARIRSNKARIRSNTQDALSSSKPESSSREYYSARMTSIMERKSESNMSQDDAEIEASKDHWTVVEPAYFTAATRIDSDSSTSEVLPESEWLSLYEENLKEMRRLQEANPESRFFRIGGDGLVLGRKIAEGGQAEIYDAGRSTFPWLLSEYQNEYLNKSESVGILMRQRHKDPVALKVFKAGWSLCELRKQWPLASVQMSNSINDDKYRTLNPVWSARLLDDGRFAFDMIRCFGDLRKFLDARMEHNGNCHPPFMMPDGNYHECCMFSIIYFIAMGMRRLHREGTLHRDLKASNVLLWFNDADRDGVQPDPRVLKHDIGCFVADYECSIGVVGTGYWRAPEILEALKNRRVGTTPNLFTPEADVYSFAMTCYEVLTGYIPFEKVGNCNGEALVDDVLQGRRPTLPSHLQPWVVEMMNDCWHMDPLKRPTFEKICDLLEDMYQNDLQWRSYSKFFSFHIFFH